MGNAYEKQIVQKRGSKLPLGVSYQNQSVNFSIVLKSKEECFLNLYSTNDNQCVEHIQMYPDESCQNLFTLNLSNFKYQGYEYVFESDGEEFLDPYAKVVRGREEFGKVFSDSELVLRGGFLGEQAGFELDAPLHMPYNRMILYKLHVRGFTKHISSGVAASGTYAGVVEKIPYLKELGVNAVLLMPIMEFDEVMKFKHSTHSKVNYWGYGASTYYYAPKSSYSSDQIHPDVEVKKMIMALHAAGIEAILEMNFSNDMNPTFILDCLKYWYMEYHVDGFKISVAEQYRSMIASDPMFLNLKLLDSGWNEREIRVFTAEEEFPTGLAEFNDGFLVDVRKFLKSDEEQLNNFSIRTKHNPNQMHVINYLTNHDGFPLNDVYTYDIKHNEENGEGNYDGRDYNFSWNCGVEGETKRRKVNSLRKKQVKNAFLALLLSQGTPMILAGDEFGNTQKGNNNGYCQDNEISWLNWSQLKLNRELFQFVKSVITFRLAHPILHCDHELRAMDYIYCGMPDISFHGTKAWQPNFNYYSREIGVLLCGRYASFDRRKFDDTIYLIYNMHWEPHVFDLPKLIDNTVWAEIIATNREIEFDEYGEFKKEELEDQRHLTVAERSVVVLINTTSEQKFRVGPKTVRKPRKKTDQKNAGKTDTKVDKNPGKNEGKNPDKNLSKNADKNPDNNLD